MDLILLELLNRKGKGIPGQGPNLAQIRPVRARRVKKNDLKIPGVAWPSPAWGMLAAHARRRPHEAEQQLCSPAETAAARTAGRGGGARRDRREGVLGLTATGLRWKEREWRRRKWHDSAELDSGEDGRELLATPAKEERKGAA